MATFFCVSVYSGLTLIFLYLGKKRRKNPNSNRFFEECSYPNETSLKIPVAGATIVGDDMGGHVGQDAYYDDVWQLLPASGIQINNHLMVWPIMLRSLT